jgi:phage terminase small subunit
MVKRAIETALEERGQRLDVDSDRVLDEIASAAFFDPIELFNDDGTLKDMSEIPENARRAIASFRVTEVHGEGGTRVFTKDIRLVKKESALTLAGRHLNMFTDKGKAKAKKGEAPKKYMDINLKLLTVQELEMLEGLVEKAGMEVEE